MLKALTFDFWETLVTTNPSSTRARIDDLAQRFPDKDRAQIAHAYAQSWEQFSQAGASGYGLPPAAILNGTLAHLEVALRPDSHHAMLERWQQATLEYPPRLNEGLPTILGELRARGLLIGLISDTGNTPGHILRELMRRWSIRSLFDWLTFSDEMGMTKRRPQVFRHTLRALGVRPSQALHVGDLPETDLAGARKAGMYTALLLEISQRRDGIAQADIVLQRFADLPGALDKWRIEP